MTPGSSGGLAGIAGRARPVARAVKNQIRRRAGFVGSVVAVRGLPRNGPTAVLTFDDGPEPGGTDRILTVLADAGATATFFVLLTRVRRYRTLLDEVVGQGHEVGLHGVDHRRLTRFGGPELRRRQRDGRAALEDATGRPVRWMRPPYGAQSPSVWLATRRAGMVPVLWGSSLSDWRGDLDQRARVAGALASVSPGGIVLGHDGFAGPADGVDDGPAPQLDRADLVGRFLAGIAERGLRARSLGDAIADGAAPVLEARFHR